MSIEEKLDQLIAVTRASSIPIKERWLDAASAGAMLSISASTFLQRYAPLPDFPKPLREGHPRWKASEILDWCEIHRDLANPRRRKAA